MSVARKPSRRTTQRRARELHAVLLRFGIDASDKSAVADVECGLHSGFPLCCILFYVKIWQPWIQTLPDICVEADMDGPRMRTIFGKFTPRYARAYDLQWAYLEADQDAGYVRCPACILAGKRVKVRDCDHFAH